MPLLAGPGAISTVILLAGRTKHTLDLFALILAIAASLVLSHIVLKLAPFLFRIMGRTGLNLLTRIMGILLTAISIQFILNGISGFLVFLKSH